MVHRVHDGIIKLFVDGCGPKVRFVGIDHLIAQDYILGAFDVFVFMSGTILGELFLDGRTGLPTLDAKAAHDWIQVEISGSGVCELKLRNWSWRIVSQLPKMQASDYSSYFQTLNRDRVFGCIYDLRTSRWSALPYPCEVILDDHSKIIFDQGGCPYNNAHKRIEFKKNEKTPNITYRSIYKPEWEPANWKPINWSSFSRGPYEWYFLRYYDVVAYNNEARFIFLPFFKDAGINPKLVSPTVRPLPKPPVRLLRPVQLVTPEVQILCMGPKPLTPPNTAAPPKSISPKTKTNASANHKILEPIGAKRVSAAIDAPPYASEENAKSFFDLSEAQLRSFAKKGIIRYLRTEDDERIYLLDPNVRYQLKTLMSDPSLMTKKRSISDESSLDGCSSPGKKPAVSMDEDIELSAVDALRKILTQKNQTMRKLEDLEAENGFYKTLFKRLTSENVEEIKKLALK
jgi:hypothetical protein